MNGDATGPVAKNVRRIAHMDIPGGGQIVAAGGYAYIGHMGAAPRHLDPRCLRSPTPQGDRFDRAS